VCVCEILHYTRTRARAHTHTPEDVIFAEGEAEAKELGHGFVEHVEKIHDARTDPTVLKRGPILLRL
jgi:hypothetical protein